MSASADRQPSELSRAIGAVARELLGEPNARMSTKTQLRFGSKGSLSVDLTKGVWQDHEAGEGGGVLDLLKRETGLLRGPAMAWLEERNLITAKQQITTVPPPWKRPITATYAYADADGVTRYEKVRFGDGLQPRFLQRQPKPSGGWIWHLKGVVPLPYRLPELLAAISEGEPIYFCEGEKDVETLVALGLVATTTGSTSSWLADHGDWFNGASTVTILPDADDAGRKHAREVAHGLTGHARVVRLLELPGLAHKGDVSEWVAAGGNAEQLEALAAAVTPEVALPAITALTFLSAEAWAEREFPAPVRLLGDLITKTTRVFLVGQTGLGKTLLGIAIAAAMATGTDFLGWRCDKPVRVLYIDGEMPGELIRLRVRDAMRRLNRQDLAGNLIIYSADTSEQIGATLSGLGELQPLNTEAGQSFVYALIEQLGGVDVVIFDNVMSLIAGDQKEEIPWSETLPLISSLTRRQIGQVWLDHTGHNTSRQYGSSTKAWRFDAVGIMTELPEEQRVDGETGFQLSFDPPGKARRRTPDNRVDFAPRIVRLAEDGWKHEGSGAVAAPKFGNVPDSRAVFYDALTAAILLSSAGPGAAMMNEWEDQCIRLGHMEAPSSGLKNDARKKAFRTAKGVLLAKKWIAIDGDRIRDLKHQYG